VIEIEPAHYQRISYAAYTDNKFLLATRLRYDGEMNEPATRIRAAGWKFDRWVDSVLMQRALGPGAGAPP
jgi:hypothetical protein